MNWLIYTIGTGCVFIFIKGVLKDKKFNINFKLNIDLKEMFLSMLSWASVVVLICLYISAIVWGIKNPLEGAALLVAVAALKYILSDK